MHTITDHTGNSLAALAETASPDNVDSPGARFLIRVAEDYAEQVSAGTFDEDDGPHEIADGAVPIYTHEVWRVFVDLAAYNEDPTELGADASDMEQAAKVALYMIAARLVHALMAESDDE